MQSKTDVSLSLNYMTYFARRKYSDMPIKPNHLISAIFFSFLVYFGVK